MRLTLLLALVLALAGCLKPAAEFEPASTTPTPPTEPPVTEPVREPTPTSPQPPSPPPASPTPTSPQAPSPTIATPPAPPAEPRTVVVVGTFHADVDACGPDAAGGCAHGVGEAQAVTNRTPASLDVQEAAPQHAALRVSWTAQQAEATPSQVRFHLEAPSGATVLGGTLAQDAVLDVPLDALLEVGTYRAWLTPIAPGAFAGIDAVFELTLTYAP